MTRSLAQLGLILFSCMATVGHSIALAVERFVGAAFEFLAVAGPTVGGTQPKALLAAAGDYMAPPAHSLRHEAGVSRRSAARNV